jgi:hypothetical protein
MEEVKPHMVKQIIVYSDGTETVINYRGVIENGVLTEDKPEKAPKPKPKKETVLDKVKKIIKRK